MEETLGVLVTVLREITPKGPCMVDVSDPYYTLDDFIVRRRVSVNGQVLGEIIVKMEEN